MPVDSHEATVALPALSVLAPTLSVAAKPYTAPKIVRARTEAKIVLRLIRCARSGPKRPFAAVPLTA